MKMKLSVAFVAAVSCVAPVTISAEELECSDVVPLWREAQGPSTSNVTDTDSDLASGVWDTAGDTSDVAVEFFSGLRGGSDAFYTEKIAALMGLYCLEVEVTKELDGTISRYVANDDPMAATVDDDGCKENSEGQIPIGCKCIELSGDFDPPPPTQSGRDYCEVIESCYWGPIVENEARVVKIQNEDTVEADVEQYYVDLGIQYLATPIALAVINFLATFVFFILRCCCGKCSGKNGDKATLSEYSKTEKMVPIFFFMLFSLIIVILAAMAHTGNDSITEGLFDTTTAAITGLDTMELFMEASAKTITDIQTVVAGAVDEAVVTLDSTDWVKEGALAVPDLLLAFSAKYAANELLADLDLEDVLNDAVTTARNSTADIVTSLDDMLATVKSNLVDAQGDIIYQTDEAIDICETVIESIAGYSEEIQELEQQLESTDLFRKGGVLALFGLTLCLMVLAYVGIIAGLTPCKGDDWTIHFMNLTWIFGSLVATLAFIVGGASLSVSVFWSDVCFFSDLIVGDFGEYVDEQTAIGMNACFNDEGLVIAYNLTSELDFAGKISSQLDVLSDMEIGASMEPVFADIADVGLLIETDLDLTVLFAELNSLTADGVSTKDPVFACVDYTVPQDHSFLFTEENVRQPWTVHDEGTSATWSGESFQRSGTESGLEYMQRVYTSNCNSDAFPPVPFDEAIEAAWTVASGTVQIKEDMFRDLGIDADICAALGCPTDDFGSDFSINSFLVDYTEDLVELQDTMLAWADSVIGDAIALVEEFQCNAYCGFMAKAYNSMHESLCSTTLGGFQVVSLALLFLAVCLIPVVITSAIMVVRLRGLWVGEVTVYGK